MSKEAFDSIMTGLTEALEHAKGDTSKGRSRIRDVQPKIKPIKKYSKADIKAIRINSDLSQRSFAAVLGVSPKTVEAWEVGTNTPSGIANRLLGLLEQDDRLFENYGILERR